MKTVIPLQILRYQLYNDNEGSQSKAQFKILTCTSFFAFFIFSFQKFGMCAGYIYVWIKQPSKITFRLHIAFAYYHVIYMYLEIIMPSGS